MLALYFLLLFVVYVVLIILIIEVQYFYCIEVKQLHLQYNFILIIFIHIY